jgi:hypothetical protein
MQIDTIPKLTAQILAIENQRQNWSNLKNEILHHRVNLEKKLGVLPEHDDTLRDAVHSCNSMIAEYDRLEESAVRYIGALGRDRDRRSEILRSKQWFDQALGISNETRSIWTRLDPITRDEVAARLSTIMRWQDPCLIVNVHNLDILSAITHLTQVYLADDSDTCLSDAKLNFEAGYADSNVRSYNIGNYGNMDLSQLPENQFGIIVCWYIFERLTLPLIEETLIKFRTLLKPGGRVLFNINDCDTELGCKFAVIDPSKSFVTRAHMDQIIAKTGLELELWHQIGPAQTLIELKRPGTPTSYKRKQGRATIGRYP